MKYSCARWKKEDSMNDTTKGGPDIPALVLRRRSHRLRSGRELDAAFVRCRIHIPDPKQ